MQAAVPGAHGDVHRATHAVWPGLKQVEAVTAGRCAVAAEPRSCWAQQRCSCSVCEHSNTSSILAGLRTAPRIGHVVARG
jgi:hypothetical protein